MPQLYLEATWVFPVEVSNFTGVLEPIASCDQTFLRDSGAYVERLGLGTTVGDEVGIGMERYDG